MYECEHNFVILQAMSEKKTTNYTTSVIIGCITAIGSSGVNYMTLPNALKDEVTKIVTRLQYIENQGIENKNRINDNLKDIQLNKIQLESLKDN